MNDESKTIAQETFDHLPQDIQEIIFSDDYQTILRNIAEDYALTKQQASQLELNTTLVLLGLVKRSDFPFVLESEMGIGEDMAEKISKEITDSILTEVWRSLDSMDSAAAESEEDIEVNFDDTENDNAADTVETATPAISSYSPASLTSLADRLKQSSITSTRSYPVAKGTVPDNLPTDEPTTPAVSETPSTPDSSPIKTIDPYHEPIEK